MSPSIRRLGTEERLDALLRSRVLYEVGAAIEPPERIVGRPPSNPAYATLFLAVMGRLTRSTVRAETDLAHGDTWAAIRLRMVAALRAHGLDLPHPGKKPPAWHHWRRLRDTHLSTDEGLATMTRAFTESSVALARSIGLLDPHGPGSFTHPDRTRALYGDGTTIRPMYRPPAAVRSPGPDGDDVISYPDPRTGELLHAPPGRFDPDTAEYHGHAGPVHGHSYVTFQARGPEPYARVILAARRVPAPGQEAATALEVLRDLHPHIRDGAQVVVYDGAMRGVHIDRIMRSFGWLTIAPIQKHKSEPGPDSPSAVRMPNGTLARGFLLGPATHISDVGPCTHLIAAIAGRVVEIGLDERGDPFVLRETHRGSIKRSPRKSGTYHFNVGITIACRDEPFTIWLAPHATETDAHRPEHFRLIPEGDDDWRSIRGIRSDAEGTWSQLKRTLIADRSASLGWRRGLIDLLSFAILNNAYAEAAYHQRSRPSRRLTFVKPAPGAV
jgi:hypothetical protein